MEKYEELSAEIRELRRSIDGLTETIAVLLGVSLRPEAEGERADVQNEMGSTLGEKAIEPSEGRPIESVLYMPSRLLHRLSAVGIKTIEQLTAHSREELSWRCGGNLTEKTMKSIVMTLGAYGFSLKEEKVYEKGDEVVASLDIPRDDAFIRKALNEFGFDETGAQTEFWMMGDLRERKRVWRWAFEAMRFAMNNPMLSREYWTYLWPKIAERDGYEVAEIVRMISERFNVLVPDKHKKPHVVLRDIGLKARELRWKADRELKECGAQ